jgi:protein-L-isoaspartate O-methyltransferase
LRSQPLRSRETPARRRVNTERSAPPRRRRGSRSAEQSSSPWALASACELDEAEVSEPGLPSRLLRHAIASVYAGEADALECRPTRAPAASVARRSLVMQGRSIEQQVRDRDAGDDPRAREVTIAGAVASPVRRRFALIAVAGLGAAALWWRKHPSACPYGQRLWVEAPHPFITRARLREALDPRPGETVLEVGPGTGYYSLDVAHLIQPAGALHLLDLQQEMLDHTMRRTREARLYNLEPRQGDARALPYPDGTFDAAFLVAVLGEVPDQDGAMRELRRVLKSTGRIVVGELAGDPHMVTAGAPARPRRARRPRVRAPSRASVRLLRSATTERRHTAVVRTPAGP